MTVWLPLPSRWIKSSSGRRSWTPGFAALERPAPPVEFAPGKWLRPLSYQVIPFPQQQAAPVIQQVAQNIPPPIPFPRQPLPMPPIPAPVLQPQAAPALETTFGLNWINRIAVITLLLGAAFLFKYGVDNNWIGPGARVLLGVAVGLLALVGGHLLAKRNQRVFAQGITGLGLALLYLAFYASSALYHVVEPGIAFALMAATTIGAGFLVPQGQRAGDCGAGNDRRDISLLSPFPAARDHPWILFSYLFLAQPGRPGSCPPATLARDRTPGLLRHRRDVRRLGCRILRCREPHPVGTVVPLWRFTRSSQLRTDALRLSGPRSCWRL